MLTDRIIDIGNLMNTGLSIESYFLLHCISRNLKDTIEQYVIKHGKIDKPVFQMLINDGWLDLRGESFIFENLKATEKTNKLFCIKKTDTLDHKRFFQELKETYPSMAKFNGKIRRLHQDLEGCERKYKAIIDSEELHKNILKCVKMNVKELMNKDGTLEYMPLMSTWINRKNYQIYLPDIEEFKEVGEENVYGSV